MSCDKDRRHLVFTCKQRDTHSWENVRGCACTEQRAFLREYVTTVTMMSSEGAKNACLVVQHGLARSPPPKPHKKEENNMRLDKYLKVSRLIKRRPVANEACDAGRILVNDKVAKASLNVKPGDVIEIQFGDKTTKVEVLRVEETYKKDEAKELYKYL